MDPKQIKYLFYQQLAHFRINKLKNSTFSVTRLFVLSLFLFFSGSQVNAATTYYLKTANQGTAGTFSNWNTDNTGGGGGTNATGFAVAAGDVFVILSTQTAVFTASTTFGSSSIGVTLQIDGTASVSSSRTLTIGVSGASSTIICNKTSTTSVSGLGTFTLVTGSTLKTANVNGITGANASLTTSTITTLPTTCNYEFTGAGAQAITGMPATVAALTVSGTSAITLGANQAMTGALTVKAGASLNLSTFTLGSPTSITMEGGATSGAVISGSGVLTLAGNVTVNDATTGTDEATISCPVALGSSVRTFNITDDGTTAIDLTMSGVISGSGGITKSTGLGTLALTGTNTYTGAVTITNGILSVNTVANASSNSSLGTGAGTSAIAMGATGTLQYTGTGHSTDRSITLSASGPVIDASGSGALTLTGITATNRALVLTGTGTGVVGGVIAIGSGTLTKTGTGTWTLSGANTYSGVTTISAGTLIAGAAVAVSTNGPFGNASSAIVMGNAATTTNNSSPSLLTGGAFTMARTITIANQATSGTYSIGGNTNNNSTFSGLVTFSQPFSVTQIATTGGNKLTISGGITGGLAGTKVVTLNNSGDISFTTVAISDGTGATAVTKANTGSATFSFANSYTGTTTVNAGSLIYGANNAISSGAITVDGATAILSLLTFSETAGIITVDNDGTISSSTGILTTTGTFEMKDGTVSAILAGAVALNKTTTGIVTLSGASTYSGITTISAGTLIAGAAVAVSTNSPFGNASSAIVMGNAATTTNNSSPSLLTGGAFTMARTITIANQATSGTYSIGGNTDNNSTFSGLITFSQPFSITQIATTGGNKLTLSGGITGGLAGTKTVTFNNIGDVSFTTTAISDGTGATAVTKANTGSATFSFANSYTGTTTVNAGSLIYGANNAISSGAITVDGATAILSLLTFSETAGIITVDNDGTISSSTGILTTTGTFEMKDGTVSAILAGAVALNKTTTGIVTLSGTNTYSGVTTISAGTLIAGTNAPSGSAGALGNAATAIVMGDAATTTNNSSPTLLTGGAFTIARTISIANQATSGTYSIGGNTDNNSTFSGLITFSQPFSITQIATTGGNKLTLSGGITGGLAGTKTVTINNIGDVSVSTTAISNGTGTTALTKSNNGSATFSFANTFTGGVTMNAGTLNINNNQALGTAAGTFTITGGTIDATTAGITTLAYPLALNGDFTFTGTNALTLGTTGSTVTMNANRQITVSASTLTIPGPISQASLDLTKAGAGTLALGSSVSLDALIISAGTLTSTSNTLTLAGDFSNSGTFSHNSGTVTLSGAAQNFGSATFNNLTLSGSGDKTMTGAVTVEGILTIGTGRILSIGANTLTLNGTIDGTNTGKITGGSTSNITIGANGSTDAGTLIMNSASSSTKMLNNLTLNRVAGTDALILGDSVRIIGVLTIVSGASLTSNNKLIFASTSNTSSGQLANMTGAAITGNVTVERFIGGGTNTRRWRFLSSPVTTTTKISGTWQQDIYITGSGTGGTTCPTLTPHSNGFDPTFSNFASMYTYDKTSQAWVAITGTNNTELVPSTGYRVLIRGDRSQGCSLLTSQSTTPADVTLSAIGTIVTGTQTISCAGTTNQWTFIGNPFQATIDLAALTFTNLKTTIWGFNPTQGLVGAWGSYVTSPVDQTNGMTQYIPAGSSFIVQTNTTATASLGIPETAKATGQGGHGLFKTIIDTVPNRLRVQLFSPDTSIGMLDESVVRFLEGATWGFEDSLDAMKYGFDPSSVEYVPNQVAVYTSVSPIRLGISRLTPLKSDEVDTVFIHANITTPGSYKLKFATVETYDPKYAVMLIDNQKGITRNLKKNNEYLLEVTSDTSTSAAGRLMIVFGDTTKLVDPPVNALTELTHTKPQLKLYPVPVDLQLTIEADDNFKFDHYSVNVYDVFGRKILLPFTIQNEKYHFDMSRLQTGVYMIELQGTSSKDTFRYSIIKN